jgi:hypothetical protein
MGHLFALLAQHLVLDVIIASFDHIRTAAPFMSRRAGRPPKQRPAQAAVQESDAVSSSRRLL